MRLWRVPPIILIGSRSKLRCEGDMTGKESGHIALQGLCRTLTLRCGVFLKAIAEQFVFRHPAVHHDGAVATTGGDIEEAVIRRGGH